MEEFGGVLFEARAWATWQTMGTCCATEGANPLDLDFSELGTQKTPIQKTELRGITLDQLQQLPLRLCLCEAGGFPKV